MNYSKKRKHLPKKKASKYARVGGNWYVKDAHIFRNGKWVLRKHSPRGLLLCACGMKKIRGWRKKQWFAVKISQITEKGFWLRNAGRDYYVPRGQYAWFLDASDREIRTVYKVYNGLGDGDGHLFVWDLLDIELPVQYFECPETLQVRNVYIRGGHRDDLYAQHIQWVKDNVSETSR